MLQHALDAVHMLKKLAAQGAEYGGAFFGTTLYWVGDIGCLWACRVYSTTRRMWRRS